MRLTNADVTEIVDLIVAVEQAQGKGLWKLGDVLYRKLEDEIEAGRPSRSVSDFLKRVQEASEDKVESGYSVRHLESIMLTSMRFPASTRKYDVAWGCYRVAASPENLEQALKMCRQTKLTPSQSNIELVMAEWRRKDMEERRAERDKAEAELEKAQAAKQKARKKKVKHKVGSKEREQAEREEQEAEAAKQKAEEAKRSAGPNAPVGNPLAPPPNKQALEIMAVAVKIDADAGRIVKMLKDNLAALDEVIDLIDPAYVEMIIASHNKIIAAATQLRERFSAKHLRFKVHEGGAA